MDKSRAQSLLRKYLNGTCTPDEKIVVEKWYLDTVGQQPDDASDLNYDQIGSEIWNRLPQSVKNQPKVSRISGWSRYAVAAIILFIVSFSVYFISNRNSSESNVIAQTDIKAGGNHATLTLADGSTVVLKDLKNGVVANQNSAVITKNSEGEIVYKVNDQQTSAEVALNTLSTPNGGTYQVELPDGTKVWLNAASSLKYPTVFKGKERVVELSGEAYFEVAKNAVMPFKVKSNDQIVEVLGTHFNINSYTNEPNVKTTLLEGSVRIHQLSSGAEKLMVPGQTASLKPSQMGIYLQNSNTENAIAWKNGEFSFQNTDLKTIMRQLERWYSIEVKYEGNVDNLSFGGSTYRNADLSEVLKVLELSGVHFKMEDKTLIVYL